MELKEAGNTAFRIGQWEKAIDLYTDALRQNKTLLPALANRAASFIQLQDWHAALRDCESALKCTNLPQQLHLKLIWRKAVCLRNLGSSQQTWQDCVSEGLRLDPRNEKFNEELSYVFVTNLECMPEMYTSGAPRLSARSATSNSDLLPALPLTYNGVMRLVRSNSAETHQFVYNNVSGKDLEAALSKAGVEPETLDYFFNMMASHPNEKLQNREYFEALERVPRYEIALLMVDTNIHAEAMKCV